MEREIKKQNPQSCRFGGYVCSGARVGTQTWALHPVVRGSSPRRSTIIYSNNTLFGELQ